MTTWKPDIEGVFYGLSAEQYHAAPGFSHSMAKHMEPPARLPAYLEHKEEPTVAMIMGTLVHQRILEPDKPLPRLAVKPEGMKFSTTEGKAWKKEKEGDGLLILTMEEHDAVVGCIDSIKTDERCQKMFMFGDSEVSLFKRHTATNVLCKARLDFVPVGDFLVDIKKVLEGQSAPDEFPRVLHDRRYYTQAKWYLDLWNALQPNNPKKEFIFVTVEGKAPYLVNVFAIDEETMSVAGERNHDNILSYHQCSGFNLWPGYSGINRVGIPKWAKAKANDKAHSEWLSKIS